MTSKVQFNHVAPQFVADEVAVAVNFYSEVLGFENHSVAVIRRLFEKEIGILCRVGPLWRC